MDLTTLRPDTLDRMVRAVALVRERLHRGCEALEGCGVVAAVIGANAVAYWVRTRDRGADRNTPNVDFLIDRADFPAAVQALGAAGFVHRPAVEEALFVDGPNGNPRSGIRLLFANERVRREHLLPAPDLSESLPTLHFRVISLQALVRMKLVAFRTIDQVHLQDMVRIGLIDSTWPDRYPPPLADRLREILADPDG